MVALYLPALHITKMFNETFYWYGVKTAQSLGPAGLTLNIFLSSWRNLAKSTEYARCCDTLAPLYKLIYKKKLSTPPRDAIAYPQ